MENSIGLLFAFSYLATKLLYFRIALGGEFSKVAILKLDNYKNVHLIDTLFFQIPFPGLSSFMVSNCNITASWSEKTIGKFHSCFGVIN